MIWRNASARNSRRRAEIARHCDKAAARGAFLSFLPLFSESHIVILIISRYYVRDREENIARKVVTMLFFPPGRKRGEGHTSYFSSGIRGGKHSSYIFIYISVKKNLYTIKRNYSPVSEKQTTSESLWLRPERWALLFFHFICSRA